MRRRRPPKKTGPEEHVELSTLVGLAMVVAALMLFVLHLPWGGKVRNEWYHAPLLMVMIAAFFIGAALTLAGFPEPINVSAGRR